MSRLLIAYASHFGQTRKIAEKLSSTLSVLGHVPVLVDLAAGETARPEEFDAAILGSRVEMERHAKQLLAFIAKHRAALEKMPTAMFSVSMSAANPDAGPDPQGYLAALFAQTRWTPTLQRAFAGGLAYRKYNFITRWIMKSISRRTHRTTDTSRDHEFTDWNAVRAFALEIDRLCTPTSRAASSDMPRT